MKKKQSLHQRFLLSRDMNKHFSGYRQEWQLDAKGVRRKVMVYYGDYYRFNHTGKALKKLQILCGVLALAAIAAYLAAVTLLPISAVSSGLVSVPELLGLFPCLYMLMGLYNLFTVKEPFEERTPLLSVRRMKHCCTGFLVLAGLSLIADLVYLLRHHVWKAPADPLFLAALVFALALHGVLLYLLSTFALVTVKKGRRTLEREAKEAAEAAAES